MLSTSSYLVQLGYVPRAGKTDALNKMFMSLFDGRPSEAIDFVKNYRGTDLPRDVLSGRRAIEDWKAGNPVRVGESGKTYRTLSFYAWHLGEERTFLPEGSLKGRDMGGSPEIVNWTQEELLKLKTTQYASAKAMLDSLSGYCREVEDPPFKLAETYESIRDWLIAREKGEMWRPRPDPTIERQAHAIVEYCMTGKVSSKPLHSEDYLLYRAMDVITTEEGGKMWPQLNNQESKRIPEGERTIEEAMLGRSITSRDHRAIVAGVALQIRYGREIRAEHMEEVAKSWPQFPDFAYYVQNLKKRGEKPRLW